MALIIDGEPFNHGTEDEAALSAAAAPGGNPTGDVTSHAQNTDVGTTALFFEIGRGSASGAAPIRRGLVFRNGTGNKVTALAWETVDGEGNQTGRLVECPLVIGGDVNNEGNVWQAPGFAAVPANFNGLGNPALFGARESFLYLLGRTNAPSPPVIGSFSPADGDVVGAAIVIDGNNFGASTGQVFLGDIQCAVEAWGNRQITTKVPTGAVSAKLRVLTSGGEDISLNTFTVIVKPVVAAPGPVSGLVAEPGNGQALLNWLAPTETGGAPIVDYVVKYRLNGLSAGGGVEPEEGEGQGAAVGGWVTYPHTPRVVPNITVSGLKNNESYDFTVQAKNTRFTGPVTDPASTTPVGSAIVYRAVQQSYTTTAEDFELKCGVGKKGTPVTRSSSDGSSTESIAEANRQALAVARTLAIDAITCPVPAGGSGLPAQNTGTKGHVLHSDGSDGSQYWGPDKEGTATGPVTGGVTTFNGRSGGVTLTAADIAAWFENGDNTTVTLNVATGKLRVNGAAADGSPSTGLPTQDQSVAGKFLKTNGTSASWADTPASGHVIKDAAGTTITQPVIEVAGGLRVVENAGAGKMRLELDPAGIAYTVVSQVGVKVDFADRYSVRASAAGNIALTEFYSVGVGGKVRIELNSTGANDTLLFGGETINTGAASYTTAAKVSAVATGGSNQSCTFYDRGGPFIPGVKNILTIECVGPNTFDFTLDPQV